jgi:hypothetical protein
MPADGGLPDYIADHFRYIVCCSKPARLAQLTFFGLGIFVALAGPWLAPDIVSDPSLLHKAVLVAIGGVFAGTFLWYVSWLQNRQHKFREEMPSSYARWYGARRRGPFGGFHLRSNIRLARLQLRYLVTSREPDSTETLALSMEFARHSLV